jgi:hypothetical protein
VQILVETKVPGHATTNPVLLENTEDGGIATDTAYYFESHPFLIEMTMEFPDREVTYRRVAE